jgi:hypothetical protein
MTKKTEVQLVRELRADELKEDSFHSYRPSVGVDANWHVVNSGDTRVAHCFGYGHSIDGGEALALRIAAALNYCHGIPTEHLLAHAKGTGVVRS